jgi:hypothetical protein
MCIEMAISQELLGIPGSNFTVIHMNSLGIFGGDLRKIEDPSAWGIC